VASDTNHQRLLRVSDRRVVEDIPVDAITSIASFIAPDPQDGVWIAGFGEFGRVRNGKADVVVRLDGREGPVTGYSLSVDSDGSVWFATTRGLYRWQSGRLNRLDATNGLPCAGIYGALRDDEGSLWLSAKCGLLRIAASDWAAWLKSPRRTVPVDVFDLHD